MLKINEAARVLLANGSKPITGSIDCKILVDAMGLEPISPPKVADLTIRLSAHDVLYHVYAHKEADKRKHEPRTYKGDLFDTIRNDAIREYDRGAIAVRPHAGIILCPGGAWVEAYVWVSREA